MIPRSCARSSACAKCPSTTARKWKRSSTFTNRRSASAEELLFPVCPELVEGPFFSLNVEEQGRGFDKLSPNGRSEEHTSELQSLMRISYAVLCLHTKKQSP